eukprot:m.49049 g.49049  ORF g.49049 m.49049 type:complete len:730 (-) comp12443_c0_seq1:166-2355(-)
MGLRFDGRVVLITGAGNGLGRAYALAFAQRGAKVVVNDLGGSVDGQGRSSNAADDVVAEIRKNGGTAVANYDSVEAGKALVDTAVKAFGRLDILVNNAGILRDRSFAKMSEQEWDAVHNVHLKGAFLVTKAAWSVMKEQRFGRVIMTSSTSGLYGNFGQANYSAAKLGLVGLSHTLGLEGAKYNITCNAIAPTAGSRLSAGVMPPAFASAIKPDFVAPLILWLCHDTCAETRGIYEVGGGWVSKLRLERTRGAVLKGSEALTPEAVRDKWSVITDWTTADHPTTNEQTTQRMLEIMEEMKQAVSAAATATTTISESEPVNVERAMAYDFKAVTYEVSPLKAALYALGVGCDHITRPSELAYVYENHSDFAALPTFAVIPAQAAAAELALGIDGLRFNPLMLLHGEQHITFHRPLPTTGTITSKAKFVELLDKGSGLLAELSVDSRDANGNLICTNVFSLFIRGKGGFGGSSKSQTPKAPVVIPDQQPTHTMEQSTQPNQAALYRLSGDVNPLHIDPDMARVAGFNQPILHGMCTLGYAVRHVMLACNLPPDSIATLQARLSKPVFPGETLQTRMWVLSETEVVFDVIVKERNETVLTLGRVTTKATKSASPSTPSSAAAHLRAFSIFAALQQNLDTNMVEQAKAVFQWNIKDSDGQTHIWTVDLKSGAGAIHEGKPKAGKADCTLTLSDDDFAALVEGKLDAMKAFMTGKLKISGNMMLAQKLQVLLKA